MYVPTCFLLRRTRAPAVQCSPLEVSASVETCSENRY